MEDVRSENKKGRDLITLRILGWEVQQTPAGGYWAKIETECKVMSVSPIMLGARKEAREPGS